MKCLSVLLFIFVLVFTVAGCDRSTAPPPPLPVEQISAEFQKAFAKASPAAKDLSGQITTAVGAKKYPAAFELIQMLQGLPDLTKEQQVIVSRTLLTVSSLLQTAQSQGDQDATSTMKQYRSNR
jgi:hypothetical protein